MLAGWIWSSSSAVAGMIAPILTSVAIMRSGKMPLSSARRLSDTSGVLVRESTCRSPDGAQRNPGQQCRGRASPHCATLHAGYGSALSDARLDGKARGAYEVGYPVV